MLNQTASRTRKIKIRINPMNNIFTELKNMFPLYLLPRKAPDKNAIDEYAVEGLDGT